MIIQSKHTVGELNFFQDICVVRAVELCFQSLQTTNQLVIENAQHMTLHPHLSKLLSWSGSTQTMRVG